MLGMTLSQAEKSLFFWFNIAFNIQATLYISKSRGPDKILLVISSLRQPICDVIHLYMYTDCLDRRDYNLHVHVFGNGILEFKYPLSCSFLTLILRRLWQKLKNVDDYLHQRTLLNSVQSLKLQRQCYVHFGYNRMHLTAWLCWLLA